MQDASRPGLYVHVLEPVTIRLGHNLDHLYWLASVEGKKEKVAQ
jgi:hypothetical protein